MCVEQIKRLLSTAICRKSAINMAEEGNSIVQTCAVFVAQNTIRLYKIIFLFFLCIYMHLYALNMQKYAKYVSMKVMCNTCKNMHFPLCWWSSGGRALRGQICSHCLPTWRDSCSFHYDAELQTLTSSRLASPTNHSRYKIQCLSWSESYLG